MFNLIIIIVIKKKKIVQPIGPTWSTWVGLDLYDKLGLVEFFLTHYGGSDIKNYSI